MTRSAADIFHGARELPASARATYLDGACGKDVALRAKVEALLKADAEAGSFLGSPAEEQAAHTAQEQAGAQIGRYKLLEQIGEGGMGTIWMAEQREPVKRRVALKIIKLGMDTRQVIARFEAERQALAMMDHPHIAKVFDAGATETGRPYFVMEYIKGIPILEFCDQNKVDTRARLQLFTQVCHAIQHAHQKGIIHRDIKPSNVLVTLHDGVPVPKVIDFGIAKATNSELTSKTLFTEHRQMVGTPAYMSPEQAEMSGLDIDTRSDIYSLGVLLYELLTGTTPFNIKALLESGFGEMLRAIREDEPHKPSTRISSLGDTGTRTALQRSVDAKKLSTLLRGDIDWIVMKCLEKDRSRRYETASGLAADIQRHLHDEPVTAGAPSAGYKLHKFVRRNRGQVLAGSAVFAALLIGVVGFAWQAKVADEQRIVAENARVSETEQRKLADASKNEAETQAKIAKEQEAAAMKSAAEARAQEAEAKKQAFIAEAIARFQTEMLAAADPQKLLGDKVTVVQVMEAAVKLLDGGSLKDQPLVEAGVRNTIGLTLRGLARYDDAEPNLRKSLAIFRAALPARHPNIATGLNNLAVVLKDQNRLAEAETLYREALEMRRAAVPDGRPELAAALNQLANLLLAQNKYAEAESVQREALAIEHAVFPAGHVVIAKSLGSLGVALAFQNKLAEAEPLFRESLAIYRAGLPAGHPEIASGLHNLAGFLHAQHRFAEAEPLHREALAIRRACLSAGHPDRRSSLDSLAVLLEAQGKFAEAEPLFREALDVSRASLPAGHKDIAHGLSDLGRLLRAQNMFVDAEPLLREALAINRVALPAGDSKLADALSDLALSLQAQNKLAEAEPLLREALTLHRAANPVGHPNIADALNNLAGLLRAMGKLGEAEPLSREALAIFRAAFPAGHPYLAVVLNNHAKLLRDQERPAEAEPLCREALEIRRAAFPAGHPQVLDSMRALAELYIETGKATEAVPLFRAWLESTRATAPKESTQLADQLASIGLQLLTLEEWSEAEALLRECLTIREKAQPEAWRTFNTRSLLGAALLGQKKYAEAETLLLDGFRGMKAREADIPPQATTRISEALERLVAFYEASGAADEAARWRSELEAARARGSKSDDDRQR
jgi:tetratricopeptide (TPR) repeat protein/tRNA A-37 threonylcarbamoyl transferase component Bud32